MRRSLAILLGTAVLGACEDVEIPAGVGESVTVTVFSAGLGSGSVTAQGLPLNCVIIDGAESGTCSVTVERGSSVTLVADPALGMELGTWGDACASFHSAAECTVRASGPVSVTAAFVPAVRNDILYIRLSEIGQGEVWIRFGGTIDSRRLIPEAFDIVDLATTFEGDIIALVRREATGLRSIWTVRPDGTQLTPLIRDGFDNYNPTFSPDGQRMAFISTRANSEGDVWVVNRNGSGLRNLTPETSAINTSDRSPAWSPTGERIAFSSNRRGFFTLWTMDPDGTNQIEVTTGPDIDTQPTWAPNGTAIAFRRSFIDGSSDIVVRQLASRAETRIVRIGTETDPAWSWNGALIAFSSDQDGDFDIYSMAPDGSAFTQITNNIAFELRPVFLRARGAIPPP